MAFIPYFIIGPTSLIGFMSLLRSKDKTDPTPADNWKDATFDLVIPSYNEADTIVLCLAMIQRQTLKPKRIFLIDDGSKDKTVENAKAYAASYQMDLTVIQRQKNMGKTVALFDAVQESDADVLGVVDADTLLRSENYFKSLLRELYQGVGIASACGTVLPLREHDRRFAYELCHLDHFAHQFPDIRFSPDRTVFQKWQRALTNAYREELYLFLQKFIYKGEMTAFGSLIFPIGCSVLYRRKYLKDVFDYYIKILGFDLTQSEDIFFGFAFAHRGYRNVQVKDVYTLTSDPRFSRIYHQIYFWSSSFLQCCYYFNGLFITPFKAFRLWIKKTREKHDPSHRILIEKRKIKEAYRQPFGTDYTERYGRGIGWFIFSTAIEKLSYPVILFILIILKRWLILAISLGAESLFYACIIMFLHKNHKTINFFKALLFTPIRYSQIMFDLIVIGKFMLDLWIKKSRAWRK